jgi:hypothetical protein
MPSALANALATEIENRDAVHANLEILDTLVHELLALTEPRHTLEEDCNCGKEKVAQGKAPYS